MTATIADLLADVPDMHKEGFRRLIEMNWATRRSLGMEVDESVMPQPVTMEEIKAGQIANGKRITKEVLAAHAGKGDAEGWFEAWHRPDLQTHDRDLPAFAVQTILANCWTPEEGRELAQAAWTLPEWPTSGVEHVWWFRVFEHVGFQCTFEGCDLHADDWDQEGDGQPITLYRGSLTGFKRGLSWTTDRERAVWFANRGDMSGKGRAMHVWRCEVPREHTYAHFNERTEHEVIADVAGLKITREKV